MSNPNPPPWGAKRKAATAVRARTVLTLFSGKDDIDSHRVRLVLAAKAVAYDLVVVDPNKPPEDLAELNPYNACPTLADRELALYDVDVICEYLDERYPHPPLLPVDPLSRARVRLAVRRIERDWLSQIEAIQTGTTGATEGIGRMQSIIKEISEYEHSIAAAVEEQSAVISDISRNAQAASAGAQETRRAAASLNDVSQRLGTLVHQFDLAESATRG